MNGQSGRSARGGRSAREARALFEERARSEERRARWEKHVREERARSEEQRVQWAERARLEERARSEVRRARWAERARSEEERARSERARSSHFLLAIAVRLLPPSERDRYLEEFRAELLDVPRDTRLSHALSLLRGVFVLRLRRGLRKEAADAAARRAKG